MRRFICAMLSVLAACAAGFGYMLLFEDELEPQAPVNAGRGLLAPVWRHFVEFAIIEITVLPTVALAFYSLFGTSWEIVTMRVAKRRLFPVHIASGAVIIFGLLANAVIGLQLHLRDAATAAIGLAFMAIGVWYRVSGNDEGLAKEALAAYLDEVRKEMLSEGMSSQDDDI